jgi:OOP family OmpA-OmpF porin
MTHLFKKQSLLALACGVAFTTLSGFAAAQNLPAAQSSYITVGGNSVLTTASGLCVRSASGPAALSTEQCDPNYRAPAVAQYVPPPAPVAPAPQAAPAVVPPPAPIVVAAIKPAPVMVKVSVNADTLFDFDKSVLRPAGRDSLDAFVAQIKGINPEVISAVGHTDRLGTDAYNQRLSEQRVASVRDYLMARGIASNRIHTEGKGESQPVTKAAECGAGNNARVIACLQPDRRVDLEVVGTRAQ